VVDHPALALPPAATPTPLLNRVLSPTVKLPVATSAPVSGPPANPSTPTLWMKPAVGNQVILSNVSESMSPQGKPGCMSFTVRATLNAADAVTVLRYYTSNEIITEARVYAPPSVVYDLTNATIKSYNESDGPSGSSVTLTLNQQKVIVQSGGTSTVSVCT
jgi:hypothetical protein